MGLGFPQKRRKALSYDRAFQGLMKFFQPLRGGLFGAASIKKTAGQKACCALELVSGLEPLTC